MYSPWLLVVLCFISVRGLPVQYEVVPAKFVDSYEHSDVPFSNGKVSFYIYEFEYPEGTSKHNTQILDIVKQHAEGRKNDFSVYIFQQAQDNGRREENVKPEIPIDDANLYGRNEENVKPEIQINEEFSPMEDQSAYNEEYPAIDVRFGLFNEVPPPFGDPQDSPVTSYNEHPVTSLNKKPVISPSVGFGGFGAIGGPGNFPRRDNKGKETVLFE